MLTLPRILLTTAFLAVSVPAMASGQLFSGVVARQVVESSGMPDCAPLCPAVATPLPDGGTRVCIANAGGCQVAEIKVLHDYLGNVTGGFRRIASRTGEFGRLNFPSSDAPILVQVAGDASHWAPLHVHDGVASIDASFVQRFAGLNAAALHPDADGRITVAQLAGQLAR